MSHISREISQTLAVNFDAAEQGAILSAIEQALYNAPTSKAGTNNMGLYIEDSWYSIARAARSSYSTTSGSGGRIELAPYAPGKTLTIPNMALNVLVGSAGQTIEFLIYDDTGPFDFPGNLIYRSNPIDIAASGLKTVATPGLVLEQGELYWIGVQYSGGGTVSAHTNVDMVSLGATPDGTGEYTSVRRAGTFGAPPQNFGFTTNDLVAVAGFPAVRFQVRL